MERSKLWQENGWGDRWNKNINNESSFNAGHINMAIKR